MATVPATQDNAANPPARRGGFLPQNDFLEGLASLGVLRQVGLLVGLAASVAVGVAVVLWSQGEDYRPLYGNLERLDSSAVLQVLDQNRIKYRIDNSTGALLVQSEKINEARLKLADAGMPNDKRVGFELLDKEQPLGTSQFMETARYRRSLEGELARTIGSITGVRGARVHLAIPKDTVFVRDSRPPSASVFVELYPGTGLQAAQVKSIVNLVASSIPEMKPENITVVDQKGTLLSQLALDDPHLVAANKQLEYSHRIEQQLRDRINSILQPLLGANKFRAEVSADIDFTAVEEAGELYNPDTPAIRSEQRIDEQRAAGTVSGVPGALSNQPPADGVAPEQIAGAPQPGAPGAVTGPQGTGPSAAPAGAAGGTAGGRVREQLVRNYELDRTLSYTKHQIGKMRRLTVAVAVDNRLPADAQPGDQGAPLVPEELERLAILVRNAVGYDAARGDVVNVVNTPFVPVVEEDAAIDGVPFYQQPWVLGIARQLGALLVVAILVLAVLRPMMKSLTQSGRETRQVAAPAVPEMSAAAPLGAEAVSLGAMPGMMLPGSDDSYEQQLTAIKGMIAEDPGRVAQVVKRWVAE